MKQSIKWALPLFLFAGACLTTAQAQTYVSGTTNLEYDPQTNTLIATCTMSSDYSTEANYYDLLYCWIVVTNTDQVVGSTYSGEDGEAEAEFTAPSPGVSYTAWGYYEVLGIWEEETYYRDRVIS